MPEKKISKTKKTKEEFIFKIVYLFFNIPIKLISLDSSVIECNEILNG